MLLHGFPNDRHARRCAHQASENNAGILVRLPDRDPGLCPLCAGSPYAGLTFRRRLHYGRGNLLPVVRRQIEETFHARSLIATALSSLVGLPVSVKPTAACTSVLENNLVEILADGLQAKSEQVGRGHCYQPEQLWHAVYPLPGGRFRQPEPGRELPMRAVGSDAGFGRRPHRRSAARRDGRYGLGEALPGLPVAA